MKKKSILLTCIVAIMALAMFVGCDNAPVLPSFVVGGNITQTEDFLIGQVFDPSKFSVTVTYDNGRIVPADSSVKVSLVEGDNPDGKVDLGDKAEVIYGIDYRSEQVTDTVGISSYAIKSLAITGPESYVFEDSLTIPASDLTVTATYLKGAEEKTMVLVPGEYTVETISEVDGLSDLNPAVSTSATVTAEVGNYDSTKKVTGEFVFTAEKPAVVVAGELTNITVTLDSDYTLLGMANGPETPTLDDVTVTAFYEQGWEVLSDEDEVVLEFIDSVSKLPITDGDFVNNTDVVVRATYNGKTAISAAVTIYPVVMVAYPTTTAKESFVTGLDLTEYPIDAADFDITLSVYVDNSYSSIINAWKLTAAEKEDVVFSYYTATGEITDGKVPGVGDGFNNLFVGAEYEGLTYDPTDDESKISVGVVVAEPAPMPVEITGVELVSWYGAPAKQHYNSLETINRTLDVRNVVSIEVAYDNDEERVITSEDGLSGDNLSVEYSLTSGSVTKLDKDSLADVDTIYIHVVWYYQDAEGEVQTLDYYEPVELNTAYAERLDVAVEYDNVAVGTDTPMYGTTYTYTVNAVNDNGVVSTLSADEYIIDGTVPETVTDAANITINAIVDTAAGQDMITGTLALENPKPWVEVSELTLASKEGFNHIYRIGSAMSELFSVDTLEGYEITGFTPHGAATVTINSTDPFEIVKSTVDSGENTVYVRVSYTEADGTDVKDELIPFSFNGVAYIEPFATATVLLNDEPFNNQLVILQEYDFSDFTLTGYTEHGDAPEPVLTSVTAHFTNGGQADLTYDATTGSFIAYDGWVYTFTFSYNTNLGAGNTYVVGNITSVNQ